MNYFCFCLFFGVVFSLQTQEQQYRYPDPVYSGGQDIRFGTLPYSPERNQYYYGQNNQQPQNPPQPTQPPYYSNVNPNNNNNYNNQFPYSPSFRPPNSPQYPFGGEGGGGEERGRGPNQYHGPPVRDLLAQLDIVGSEECTRNVASQWAFETNVSPETQHQALDSQLQYARFQRAVWQLVKGLDQSQVVDPILWRMIRHLSVIGPSALPPDLLDRYNALINDMLSIYNSATICAYNEPFNCGLRLEPELNWIMARSRDWDELQHIWLEWRRRTGQQIRDLYEQLVEISNQAARINKLESFADFWTFPYESPSLRLEIDEVWEEVRPLYELLHAYVRRKLRDLYGPEKLSRNAPLPAHVLGDMWAQSWTNILDITVPYPGKNFLDVTPRMLEQGYTPHAMFRVAEEFFLSMNLSAMPPDFWSGSILEEPGDRPIVCQPSAWDFCNRKDYRVKMCSRVAMKDFIMAHHEMAHIQYFLHYRHLPKVFRDGANPGFHEAIGEAIALSVSTPKHLQNLGLVLNSVDDVPHNINYLFAMALDKLPFLPFSLVMDRWRWDVFQGQVSKERYNCHWWQLREQYSGIKPPLLRSEIDFDPGSKYHIPANIPYIRYFVATILQFQLHRSMCLAAGQYQPGNLQKPLHKCDIYRSKEAGKLLGDMMRLGASVPWQEALHTATGESRLSGQALREYFRPLEEWLRSENLRTQEFVGWTYDGDYCKQSIETAGLQVYGGYYNYQTRHTPSTITALLISALFISII